MLIYACVCLSGRADSVVGATNSDFYLQPIQGAQRKSQGLHTTTWNHIEEDLLIGASTM